MGLSLLVTGIPWIAGYLVGYSRFEARANAWNQIMYGMLIGFWFGVFGFYVVFEPVHSHSRTVNRAEQT